MDSLIKEQIWIIAGAESSGKTTLFNQLKWYLPHCSFIPELDRKWLEDRHYTPPFSEALLSQMFEYCLHEYQSLKVLLPCIMDTDILNLMIWAEHLQHPMHNALQRAFEQHKNRKYILCPPNIPFEPDPLRTNESTRSWVWKRHLEILPADQCLILKSDSPEGRWEEINHLFI
jgi:nicotinamide riboside kinase